MFLIVTAFIATMPMHDRLNLAFLSIIIVSSGAYFSYKNFAALLSEFQLIDRVVDLLLPK